ncbi:MAG: aminomethyl-transferring glycine dehydrogenase subunit GcvPA [Coriobacteriia bacterium]|nr:aminomethyl-transferring glycine dehydrogenase subunit GcvPA [Coriobacteriia bacterium]
MGSYIPATQDERADLLKACGLDSVDDLFAIVPPEARVSELNLEPGLSELEVSEKVRAIADKNVLFKSIFRGAGAYNHYIPSIVKTITTKEEFVTAYTPYQAEISQGVLQSIFEYQTQICELTGMDVSNASVYDGATAAAEAVIMLEERKKSGVVVCAGVHPQVKEVVETYAASRGIEVSYAGSGFTTSPEELATALEGKAAASVLVQSPNFFGSIEDVAGLAEATHTAGAKLIMSANPISLGALKTPADLGADVAVGEGQPLGMPLAFGGPYLGYMATTTKNMRKLPGRIVGQTTDDEGRRAFVLTLQAREQHIRREKASSNICSNQALCAMTASVYLAAVGPDGLAQVAQNSAAHAHYLAEELAKLGFETKNDGAFFNEFVTSCPVDVEVLLSSLAESGILGGLPVEDGILWCCTEVNTKAQIDSLLSAIKEVL